MAVKNHKLECARHLIQEKCPIYIDDPLKADESPLFHAVRSGKEVLELLFTHSHQRDFDLYTNSKGMNILHIAH